MSSSHKPQRPNSPQPPNKPQRSNQSAKQNQSEPSKPMKKQKRENREPLLPRLDNSAEVPVMFRAQIEEAHGSLQFVGKVQGSNGKEEKSDIANEWLKEWLEPWKTKASSPYLLFFHDFRTSTIQTKQSRINSSIFYKLTKISQSCGATNDDSEYLDCDDR